MTTAHFNRLLKQLSMGDMSALERLYNHYYATICSVAYCRLRKKEDAQDIASVVMIKLCSVSDKYIRNPNGFVYTLTVNCVKDFLKRKKPVVVEDFENTVPVKENGNWLYVEQILASLSDVDRKIVVQHVFGEYEVQGGDYYILNFIYHLDDRYHFGDKSIYESLTDKVVVGDYTIYYGEGNPNTLFVNYLLKIEYQGNVCYADVECFEHSFDDLVALLTGTLS